MPGLADSRWASAQPNLRTWPHHSMPPAPRLQPEQQQQQQQQRQPPRPYAAIAPIGSQSPPERELSRYLKLVARLKWKLPFLAEGYRIAIDRAGRPPEDVAANEIHFKIDFYEYYMHIERALVHLMGVFGIKVQSLGDSVHNPSINNPHGKPPQPRPRMGVIGVQAQHRYHANVLAALDRPDNPLHEVLGQNEVRQQLARAKELRNRWKNADEYAEERGFTPAPLEAYNLEMILTTIFGGLEHGLMLAEMHVKSLDGAANGSQANAMDWGQEEDDWGFVVDAMDWEAI
ncbi:hypothetical protein BJ170DRAFT_638021 [Xylariales sp. AK1849]|nr:hypothetical protein BJ170DRAFT_638021 [Xylariales sp. AK1849]